MRNPNWTRDELILALDLYFRVNPSHHTQQHPEVITLSELLNELPIHRGAQTGGNFRNPNGVYMKLCNFLRLDPDYPGKGLDAGSKLDEEVWNEFSSDRRRLGEVADAIKNNLHAVSRELTPEDLDEDCIEGQLLTRIHRTRERNTQIVARKKRSVLRETGALRCEVCGFDYGEFYGELGENFAECHHLVPLSELDCEKPTQLEDLAIVCANCHRILHRTKPMPSIHELRMHVLSRQD